MPQATPQFTKFPDLPREIRWMIWEMTLPAPRLVHIRQRRIRRTIREWEIDTGRQWPKLKDDDNDEDGTYGEFSSNGNTLGSIEHGDDDENSNDSASDDVMENYWISFGGLGAYRRAQIRTGLRAAMDKYAYDDEGYKDAHLVGIYSESPTPEIAYVCREARDVVLKHYTPMLYCESSFPQTYFNFTTDTLYMCFEDFSSYFAGEGLVSVVDDLKDRFPIEDVENLNQIERLAILVEREEYESGPKEELIASVLGHFCGVKHLSLVVRHFEDTSCQENLTSLTLIEPIDVDEALDNYKNFTKELWQLGVPELPIEPELCLRCATLDMTEFEKHWVIHCQANGNPRPLPKIYIKAVVSTGLLDSLERERLNYEVAIE